MKILITILLLLFNPIKLIASHIIGGELTYTSLDNNLYEVKLTMYRDCGPSSNPFSNSYPLFIYNLDNNNSSIQTLFNSEFNYIEYDALANNCVELPQGICIEQAIFTAIIEINNPENNYAIYTQTCCRDEAVINIAYPAYEGVTFSAFIPSDDITTNNNSAQFNSYPPLGLCLGEDINIDLSATDIDGDSLTYELTTPYNDINWNPPFNTVQWGANYSDNYPMDASPPLTIDPVTGLITGTPSQLGMYIIAIKVSEYHQGILINELIRDFRFLVVDCESTTAYFPESEWYCNSLTVDFTNESQDAESYLWTFGDPTNPDFSTTIESPSYTYPANGSYTVSLIADPGEICADTMTTELPVIDGVYATFTSEEIVCSNNLNFIPQGLFPPNSSFSWNFGTNASPQTSSSLIPPSVNFNNSGLHEVSLTVSYNNCDSTTTNYIESIDPIIDPQISSEGSLCFVDNALQFSTIGNFPSSSIYTWNFGPNSSAQTSSEISPPEISFNTTGFQEINLTINYNDCLYTTYDSIYIIPTQNTTFYADHTEGCEPFSVLFTPTPLSSNFEYNWDFEGGMSNTSLPSHTFSEGYYDITLEIIDTISGCTYTHEIENYIQVSPKPTAGFAILNEPLYFQDQIWIENQAVNSTYYLYDFGNGYTTDVENPIHTPSEIWDYEITQYAMNDIGCRDSTTLTVFIDYPFTIYLPNAFTPNNDNLNDTFFAELYRVDYYEMKIFNRWGEMVFNNSGEKPSWDGKSTNGSECSQDTYIYTINYHSLEHGWGRLQGTINLLR